MTDQNTLLLIYRTKDVPLLLTLSAVLKRLPADDDDILGDAVPATIEEY